MSTLAAPAVSAAEERPGSPGQQEITESIGRLLHSETFRRCARLRDFLSFVVDCSLHGRVHEINEYSLGVQVFGKSADYTPSQDNIVRSTARQLRAKLTEYYASEGALEQWRIEIPKGAYVPLWRLAVPVVAHPALDAVHLPDPPAVSPPLSRVKPLYVLTALCAALALLAAGFFVGAGARRVSTGEISLLGNMLSTPGTPTTLVLDDPYLPVLANRFAHPISLKEYLETPSSGSAGAVFQPAAITSSSTAQLLVKLAAGGHGFPAMKVRHCHDLQMRDLGAGNFVFFGGVGSNPWVGLLQKNTNFQNIFEPNGRRGFVNRHPINGEPPQFAVTGPGEPDNKSYARVAIFHNPMGSGQIALIGGTSRLSTEAAGDFALSRSGLLQATALCPEFPQNPDSSLEVILETASLAGAPAPAQVVAHRCSPRIGP